MTTGEKLTEKLQEAWRKYSKRLPPSLWASGYDVFVAGYLSGEQALVEELKETLAKTKAENKQLRREAKELQHHTEYCDCSCHADQEEVEQKCGEKDEVQEPDGLTVLMCAREAGHRGNHRDRTGAEWRPRRGRT